MYTNEPFLDLSLLLVKLERWNKLHWFKNSFLHPPDWVLEVYLYRVVRKKQAKTDERFWTSPLLVKLERCNKLFKSKLSTGVGDICVSNFLCTGWYKKSERRSSNNCLMSFSCCKEKNLNFDIHERILNFLGFILNNFLRAI